MPFVSAGITVKKKKEKWVDDGRTIAPMTGEEIPSMSRGFFPGHERKRNRKRVKSDITRKERNAMIRAFFIVMLPRLLIVLGCFALVGLLMYFWLI